MRNIGTGLIALSLCAVLGGACASPSTGPDPGQRLPEKTGPSPTAEDPETPTDSSSKSTSEPTGEEPATDTASRVPDGNATGPAPPSLTPSDGRTPLSTETPTAEGSAQLRLACNGTGPSFPAEALDRSPLDKADLQRLPFGAAMVEDFASGEAAVEASQFQAAEAFVVLDEDQSHALVGGVESGHVVSSFELERMEGEWRLRGWGGCRPTAVDGDRRAAAWSVVRVGANGRSLELEVEGGECVGAESETRTQIVQIDVRETQDQVAVTVWVVEPPPPGGACAGVGLALPLSVQLEDDLGARSLVDAGEVPPHPKCPPPDAEDC